MQHCRDTLKLDSCVEPVPGNELRKILTNVKHNKPPGCNGVTNSMIIHLPCHFIHQLIGMRNCALKLQHLPSIWKKLGLVAISKPEKDYKFPKNLEPMSLLSCLWKIYEKILWDRMMNHISTNDLIADEQFGCMPDFSTAHPVTKLRTFVTSGFDKMMTTVLFLDTSKEYYSTWPLGLIYKWTQMKFPGKWITVIVSSFAQRSLRITMDGTFSGRKPILVGVPQGSDLSPML